MQKINLKNTSIALLFAIEWQTHFVYCILLLILFQDQVLQNAVYSCNR